MVIIKEKLTDLKECYEKAMKLVETESKHDPENEPYKSHYAAREMLIEMQNNLKNTLSTLVAEDNPDEHDVLIYKAILGFILKELGRVSIYVDELKTGENYLTESTTLFEEFKLEPEGIIAYIDALNNLGILWSNRNNAENSKQYLDQAEAAYNDFKAIGKSPLTMTDMFGTKDEVEDGRGEIALEKLYTLTLYYLAQILGSLDNLDKSASYCHTTIKRQLQYNDYEPIDWSLNVASLSQYFIKRKSYNVARHLLSAATYMMEKYKDEMYTPEMSEDEKAAILETYQHRYADVARCWAKYGLDILLSSKERLMDDKEETETTEGIESLNLTDDIKSMHFETLDLKKYESEITDKYCLVFNDAKLVFRNVEKWLTKAKEYYRADTEATEYVKIVQDMSSNYKNLVFFEEDAGNQCKLHKMSADLLEELVIMLNPVYYMSLCRELWYELGLIYARMLDVKLDALEKLTANETATPHALKKINLLCNKSIKNFQHFINSFADKTTKEIPAYISADNLLPINYAYFHLGRLYYKLTTPDKLMQIDNIKNSLKYYNLLITGCENSKDAQEAFKGELGVSKEMAMLLPLKIKRILEEIK